MKGDNNTIRGCYFAYLTELVKMYADNRDEYIFVLRSLHSIPMLSLMPNDENICEWGLELRRGFGYAYPMFDEDAIIEALPPQCTMLEAAIFMSERTNEQIARDTYDIHGNSDIFWEMILENVGLMEYNETKISRSRRAMDQVEVILRHLNERDYEPDGEGNWFWLREPRNGIDMRKIPLTEQMWAYVNEGQGVRWS